MKRKRTVIGISVAAVLAVCAVVLAVVFGVRAIKKPPHVHEYCFSALIWEWEESGSARASASCACGEKREFQAEITQTPIVPASCEGTGKSLFTAKIRADGAQYTDAREFVLPALGHEYDDSAIVWSWEEDGTATANAPCKRGEHTLLLTPETEEEILVEPDCESEGSALYTARIPNGVKDIGEFAFSYCKLQSVALPKALERIGEGAFRECGSLKEIVIPIGVTEMGAGVFGETQMVAIYCEAASKPIGWQDHWNGNCPVYWAYEYAVDDEIGVWIDE